MSVPPSLGPVTRLREHNERVLQLREHIREANLRQRLMHGFGACVVLCVLGVAIQQLDQPPEARDPSG